MNVHVQCVNPKCGHVAEVTLQAEHFKEGVAIKCPNCDTLNHYPFKLVLPNKKAPNQPPPQQNPTPNGQNPKENLVDKTQINQQKSNPLDPNKTEILGNYGEVIVYTGNTPQIFRLGIGRNVFGRKADTTKGGLQFPNCAFVTADKSVGRRHFVIEVQPTSVEGIFKYALYSSAKIDNGTAYDITVKGNRVLRSVRLANGSISYEAIYLGHGDPLWVGNSKLKIVLSLTNIPNNPVNPNATIIM